MYLVPEICRAYLHGLVDWLIPLHPQRLQVSDDDSKMLSPAGEGGPFPASGCRAPNLLQQHLQTSLQQEAPVAFCRELPTEPVLARAWRLHSDMVRRGHLLHHWQPAAQLCSTVESGTGWQIQFIMPCERPSQSCE